MPKWGKYKKSYRKEWESDPVLNTWIAPAQDDPAKASCKYCNTIIRSHYNDLKEHGQTNKHQPRCAPSVKSFNVPASAGPSGTIKDDQKRRV